MGKVYLENYKKEQFKNVYFITGTATGVCDNDNIRSNKVAKSTEFVFEASDNYFEL